MTDDEYRRLIGWDIASINWALDRIVELEALTLSQAERIAAQSDLLSRRAEAIPTVEPIWSLRPFIVEVEP